MLVQGRIELHSEVIVHKPVTVGKHYGRRLMAEHIMLSVIIQSAPFRPTEVTGAAIDQSFQDFFTHTPESTYAIVLVAVHGHKAGTFHVVLFLVLMQLQTILNQIQSQLGRTGEVAELQDHGLADITHPLVLLFQGRITVRIMSTFALGPVPYNVIRITVCRRGHAAVRIGTGGEVGQKVELLGQPCQCTCFDLRGVTGYYDATFGRKHTLTQRSVAGTLVQVLKIETVRLDIFTGTGGVPSGVGEEGFERYGQQTTPGHFEKAQGAGHGNGAVVLRTGQSKGGHVGIAAVHEGHEGRITLCQCRFLHYVFF